MKRKHITRLEAQLEGLVEGTFASLFGKRIRAQDLALRLARAMEDTAAPPHGSDSRFIAPDEYRITVAPALHNALLHDNPNLAGTLADHLVELAESGDYRLLRKPVVKLLADPGLDDKALTVHAAHSSTVNDSSTAAMQPVSNSGTAAAYHPTIGQLIINDRRVITLEREVTNIGRHPDNHIVIADPTVSRHHAQIRLRFGVHVIFNVSSRFGTFVNEVSVKEHTLNAGDVISLGDTRIIYTTNAPHDDSTTGQTGELHPL